MLDKRSIALLNVIIAECADTGYKIFSFNELVSFMPLRYYIDSEGVKERLKSLSDHEYISVKYQDDNEVCLRPLLKGRVAIENKADSDYAELNLKRRFAVFAFFGGVAGGLIAGLIVYLIKALGGA